jgi:outer membrane protein assembly factor BamB
MQTSELIFIGIKGSVVALNRATGEQVWATHLKGSDFVNVVFENGKLFATCEGEAFCIDPLSGTGLWQNRLKGFGTGVATIASEDVVQGTLRAVLAEKHRRDQEAAAGAVAAVTAAS